MQQAHYSKARGPLVRIKLLAQAPGERCGVIRAMAERNGDFFWSSRVPNAFGWIHRELQNFEAAVASAGKVPTRRAASMWRRPRSIH